MKLKKKVSEAGIAAYMLIGFALVAILFLSSCRTVYQHVRKAEKHIARAVALDPSIKTNETDTLTLIEYDTIRGKDGRDSIIYETITITPPCPEYDFSEVRSKSEAKQEEKTKRKEIKEGGKTYRKKIKEEGRTKRTETRHDTKRERIKSRSLWWLWLLLGALLGAAVTREFYKRRARDGLRNRATQ